MKEKWNEHHLSNSRYRENNATVHEFCQFQWIDSFGHKLKKEAIKKISINKRASVNVMLKLWNCVLLFANFYISLSLSPSLLSFIRPPFERRNSTVVHYQQVHNNYMSSQKFQSVLFSSSVFTRNHTNQNHKNKKAAKEQFMQKKAHTHGHRYTWAQI